jgi:hypothetical protein
MFRLRQALLSMDAHGCAQRRPAIVAKDAWDREYQWHPHI